MWIAVVAGPSPEVGRALEILVDALQVSACKGRLDPLHLAETLVFSRENTSSIVSCMSAATEGIWRHCGSSAARRLWEQLNKLYLQVHRSPPGKRLDLEFARTVRAVQEARIFCQGITDATMARRRLAIISTWKIRGTDSDAGALMNTHFNRQPRLRICRWTARNI